MTDVAAGTGGEGSASEPRNMQTGWCARGTGFAEAAALIAADRFERARSEFKSDRPKVGESLAAFYLLAFTGLDPTPLDRERGGDGIVDFKLTGRESGLQVVEVTSSLDRVFQSAQAASREIEGRLVAGYLGASSWALELERDWERTQLKPLAPKLLEKLHACDAEGMPVWRERIHPRVLATTRSEATEPIVQIVSSNAGAVNVDRPYLDALTEYLQTPAITSKIEKLERDAVRLGAERRHLFIMMASMGKLGGLLPSSPSYFTWGRFAPPVGLTDLWLYGHNGMLFHWDGESGWVFHEL